MAIVSQHHLSLNHTRIHLNQISPPTRINCSATAPPRPRRPDTLKHVTLTPARPTPNDPSLQSNWSHRAWLTTGCATVLLTLAKSVEGAAESQMWLEPILGALIGYVMADLGSGVYHWGIDNYGSANTPVFGPQIDAFQGHHRWPWVITRRQPANNLHTLARAVTFALLPVGLLSGENPGYLGFAAVCGGCVMLSQQFHAWAHAPRGKVPAAVAALQERGLLVSREQHAAHHRQPYNNNYCIVSGVWNEVLDKSKFFEALEMVIFFKFGVRPRSWSEPNYAWIEEKEEDDDDTACLLSS